MPRGRATHLVYRGRRHSTAAEWYRSAPAAAPEVFRDGGFVCRPVSRAAGWVSSRSCEISSAARSLRHPPVPCVTVAPEHIRSSSSEGTVLRQPRREPAQFSTVTCRYEHASSTQAQDRGILKFNMIINILGEQYCDFGNNIDQETFWFVFFFPINIKF